MINKIIMKHPLIFNLSLILILLAGCSKAPTTEEQKERAKELVKAPTELVTGETFSVPELNLDMLWCKPGTFMMGSPAEEKFREDDETQHRVNLTQGFWLGKYEVTQAPWEKVMRSMPGNFKGATLPVEGVSWDDVMQFCEKLTWPVPFAPQ